MLIKKTCTNLLLKSGKATTKDLLNNSHAFLANKIQDKVEDVDKPLFKQSLDDLGPVTVEFLGIDKKLGIIISDGIHAITCNLKRKALKQFKSYIKEDVSSLIGRKLVLNPNGKK